VCTTLLHCPPLAREFAPRIAPVTRIGVEIRSAVESGRPDSRGTTGRWSVVEDVEESGGLSQPPPPQSGAAARRRRPEVARHAARTTSRSHDAPPRGRGDGMLRDLTGVGSGPPGREARGGADPRLPTDGGLRRTAPGRLARPLTRARQQPSGRQAPASRQPSGRTALAGRPAPPGRRPVARPGRTTCRAHVAPVARTAASRRIRRHFSRPRDGQRHHPGRLTHPPPDTRNGAGPEGPTPWRSVESR
jgi:hypothetical protein